MSPLKRQLFPDTGLVRPKKKITALFENQYSHLILSDQFNSTQHDYKVPAVSKARC